MRTLFSLALAGAAVMGLSGTAKAVPVDLELSLVVDSSGSIDTAEFSQQIDGYADAFRQSAVVDSIVNSPNGVAVNTILFASSATEVIGFRHLRTADEVLQFADELAAVTRISGGTNIASGILLATEALNTNNFETGNIIIDVSGDGTAGVSATQQARDAALSAGVSRINGLAIGGQGIFDFYQANVIGGPDAFVLQADSFDEFDAAIANKIEVEVGGPDPEPTPVPAPGAIGLIGVGVVAIGLALRRRRS